jgi:thiol-disulfide isomerase/thioredoxin
VKLTVRDEPEVVHDYRISRRPVSRAPFTGRVVAASDGKPLTGATVAIADAEDANEHTFPLRTDADGRFQTVRAAHHGYIEASSLDGALGAVVEIGPDANDVVVPLAPAATARGVLLDEESKPVANLKLFTMNQQKSWKDGKPSNSTNSYSIRQFTTDGEGRFALTGLVVGQSYTIVAMINRSESRDVGVIAPNAPGPIDAVTLRIGYDNPRLPENLVVFRNDSPDVGKVLPEFTATTLDGKPLSLKDFAGKYVLLDFWATWCGPCLEEIPRLQDVHDAFAEDDRFTILSLSVDKTIDLPRAFQEKHKAPWPQGYIGTAPHSFGTGPHGFQPGAFPIPSIPDFVLVGPDGKIVARGMRGPFIMLAVEAALAKPK